MNARSGVRTGAQEIRRNQLLLVAAERDDICPPSHPEHVRAATDWGRRTSGRASLQITGMKLGNLVPGEQASIASMQFEVELAFTGALNLWQLPSRYVLPARYVGWVTVHVEQKDAPLSPKNGSSYLVRIPESGVARTASNLRTDNRDATFVLSDGTQLQLSAPQQRVWSWTNVEDGACGRYHVFVVGTRQEFDVAPKNEWGGPPQGPRC